ncbi:MAG TPA: transglutaminase family protein [Chitinophagaceae bacterium]|nr:transglutaminase family protein [Chitinophagaceae bacterium]HNF72505.1 transglutaminase family protein [Chitinophagaceae bacterium]
MKENKELKALIHLLDDPDGEVYHTVSDKLIHYGKAVIPKLENLWENTHDNRLQERIEDIIHKVNFNEVFQNMEVWVQASKPALLSGAILMASYRYSEIDENAVRKTLKSLYQSCWLELHNYLTPLEQVNIINSIFFNMYKFKGLELEENKPAHYFINEVMESRQGNNYSLGLIYQILCEMLDIPVMAIQLPKQYVLAYYDTLHDFFHKEKNPIYKIQFFIDPNNGMIYTQEDVDAFISKYEIQRTEGLFSPLSHQEIIGRNLDALAQVYQLLNENDKVEELNQLLELFPAMD